MSDDAPNSDEGAKQTGDKNKVEDLAKAGRKNMETDDDQVAEGKWKSTSDGSGTSETD